MDFNSFGTCGKIYSTKQSLSEIPMEHWYILIFHRGCAQDLIIHCLHYENAFHQNRDAHKNFPG